MRMSNQLPGKDSGDNEDSIRTRWLEIADTYPDDHKERNKILKQIEEFENEQRSSKNKKGNPNEVVAVLTFEKNRL